MSNWKSSLGAHITDSEYARLRLGWDKFCSSVMGLPGEPDPYEMLEILAEIIGEAHLLQRIIHDVWSDANRRAFPRTRESSLMDKARSVLGDLRSLGLTEDQITTIINGSKE